MQLIFKATKCWFHKTDIADLSCLELQSQNLTLSNPAERVSNWNYSYTKKQFQTFFAAGALQILRMLNDEWWVPNNSFQVGNNLHDGGHRRKRCACHSSSDGSPISSVAQRRRSLTTHLDVEFRRGTIEFASVDEPPTIQLAHFANTPQRWRPSVERAARWNVSSSGHRMRSDNGQLAFDVSVTVTCHAEHLQQKKEKKLSKSISKLSKLFVSLGFNGTFSKIRLFIMKNRADKLHKHKQI